MSDKDGNDPPHLVALDGDGAALSHDCAPSSEEIGANDEAVQLKISALEQEHRDLDQAIQTLEERMPYDRLAIQRMKKRKLALRDQISELHSQILPDIIA
ncbi:MAG: DUF465 domain-containing protein [Pseudomonadota bacterium]